MKSKEDHCLLKDTVTIPLDKEAAAPTHIDVLSIVVPLCTATNKSYIYVRSNNVSGKRVHRPNPPLLPRK